MLLSFQYHIYILIYKEQLLDDYIKIIPNELLSFYKNY